MEACTSGFGALCVSRFDAARQIMVLQSLVTLLQDKLERADVRAALLQDELDEAEKGRVRAKDRRSHRHLIDTLTSIARISLSAVCCPGRGQGSCCGDQVANCRLPLSNRRAWRRVRRGRVELERTTIVSQCPRLAHDAAPPQEALS